ncbi:unnamed protein product [Echinostoma caproni]|uniref:Rx_N domain-containing protein n=1 Tax=Echinostoma caproni TaxID=27848 RepID=A0A183A8T5_9TREM|nr:unnamed protein product [Echinostoma caproni]
MYHLVDASLSKDHVIAGQAVQGLRRYIRHLLADMNAAHKVRESQLHSMNKQMREKLQAIRESLKHVLLAYV